MTKHTPGAWSVGYRDNQCVYSGGKHVATVQCSVKQWEANARLIAAAPELLGTGKGVLSIWDDLYSHQSDPEEREAWEAFRTAIAKAEGGAP